MAVLWSSSGSFGNALITDQPQAFQTINRGQTIFSVPPGSYGPLARLVVVFCGKGDNPITLSPGLALSFSPSFFFGPNRVANFDPSPTSDPPFTTAHTGDMWAWWAHYFYTQSIAPLASDPAHWDAGLSVTATSAFNSVYRLTGTLTSTTSSTTISGVGTHFLSELVPTQRVLAPGYLQLDGGGNFIGTAVVSVADDTHFTADTTPSSVGSTGSANGTFCAGSESISWIAALLSFDPAVYTTEPTAPGVSSSTSGANPTLLNNTNFLGLSGSSLNSTFGPTRANTSAGGVHTFDEFLDDSAVGDFGCVDGFSIVLGYTLGSPGGIDLVNGNPNWNALGNISVAGLNGQYSTFAAMANWTRPDPYDTSFAWTGVPATPTTTSDGDRGGFSRIWMWPRVPGSGGATGRSRAYIIA